MFSLKRLLFILAIGSVLGLSILGGILIRNKIIWDNWLSQQLYIYNRQVKNLENEINLLDNDLNKNIKNKENLSEKIKYQKENIDQLENTINRFKENIQKLKLVSHFIPFKKSKKIEKALIKSKKIALKLPEIEAKKELLNKELSEFDDNNESVNNFEEFTKKILELNKILKEQEEILAEYVNNRIKINRFLNKNKEIYKQKLKQKTEIIQKIKENNNSFNLLNELISSLTNLIDNKKKELENLLLKNPLNYW